MGPRKHMIRPFSAQQSLMTEWQSGCSTCSRCSTALAQTSVCFYVRLLPFCLTGDRPAEILGRGTYSTMGRLMVRVMPQRHAPSLNGEFPSMSDVLHLVTAGSVCAQHSHRSIEARRRNSLLPRAAAACMPMFVDELIVAAGATDRSVNLCGVQQGSEGDHAGCAQSPPSQPCCMPPCSGPSLSAPACWAAAQRQHTATTSSSCSSTPRAEWGRCCGCWTRRLHTMLGCGQQQLASSPGRHGRIRLGWQPAPGDDGCQTPSASTAPAGH